jgi:hypothetical protein
MRSRMTIPGPCTEVVRNPFRLRRLSSQAACQLLLLNCVFPDARQKCRKAHNSAGKSRCVFEGFMQSCAARAAISPRSHGKDQFAATDCIQ